MRGYRPEELFDAGGSLRPELKETGALGGAPPEREPRRRTAGRSARPLKLPDFRNYAVGMAAPGATTAENTQALAAFLRDVMRENMGTFRVFGPDETASNRLSAIYEASRKTWMLPKS